jgi:hypothetical protein
MTDAILEAVGNLMRRTRMSDLVMIFVGILLAVNVSWWLGKVRYAWKPVPGQEIFDTIRRIRSTLRPVTKKKMRFVGQLLMLILVFHLGEHLILWIFSDVVRAISLCLVALIVTALAVLSLEEKA